uniref:Uncharacterized protein n=1 Tax=Ciona savignyi TaxID=51511 RepID=H2YM42_CIOSA
MQWIRIGGRWSYGDPQSPVRRRIGKTFEEWRIFLSNFPGHCADELDVQAGKDDALIVMKTTCSKKSIRIHFGKLLDFVLYYKSRPKYDGYFKYKSNP